MPHRQSRWRSLLPLLRPLSCQHPVRRQQAKQEQGHQPPPPPPQELPCRCPRAGRQAVVALARRWMCFMAAQSAATCGVAATLAGRGSRQPRGPACGGSQPRDTPKQASRRPLCSGPPQSSSKTRLPTSPKYDPRPRSLVWRTSCPRQAGTRLLPLKRAPTVSAWSPFALRYASSTRRTSAAVPPAPPRPHQEPLQRSRQRRPAAGVPQPGAPAVPAVQPPMGGTEGA